MPTKEELINVLCREQKERGGLSEPVLNEIARSLDMPLSEVYGVATFYSFITTRPVGRYVIRVCKSLPCIYKNSGSVLQVIRNELAIKPGQITADRKFSLELTNCIGGCDNPPAMMVNDTIYNGLTGEKILKILHDCE